MAAAIIKLDSLSDTARPAAENHDLWPIRHIGLVFLFVSRIKIWRERFELRRAGIDTLENWFHAQFMPPLAHRRRLDVPQFRNLFVARARPLRFKQQFG